MLAGLGTALVCAAAYLMAPDSAAGSAFFPLRFLTFATTLFILFVGCIAAKSREASWLLTAAAIVNTSCLFALNRYYSPLARDIVSAELRLPRVPPGTSGIYVVPEGRASCSQDGTNRQCANAGADYFRTARAVLLEAPWTRLPISILDTSVRESWVGLDAYQLNRWLTVTPKGSAAPDFAFAIVEGHVQDDVVRRIAHALIKQYDLIPLATGSNWLRFLVRRNRLDLIAAAQERGTIR